MSSNGYIVALLSKTATGIFLESLKSIGQLQQSKIIVKIYSMRTDELNLTMEKLGF